MKKGIIALLALAGCVVHRDRPHRHPPPSSPPPARQVTVVRAASWHDVRFVLWAEYFDCSEDEIGYCESLRGYDDADVFVMLYIARCRRVPVRTVVLEYDRCGRSLWTVSLRFGMTGDEYFLAEVPARASCPPPYGKAYGHWRNRERGYVLSNEECHALVHLRIGVHFYGYSAEDYFREHESLRGRGVAHPLREMAARDCGKAGAGGKTAAMAAPKKADRPWEASDRREWERRREESRARAAGPQRAQEDSKARDDAQRAKAVEEARRHDEEKRRVAEEKKKADDEARRRDEESKKREDEKGKKDDPGKGPDKGKGNDGDKPPPGGGKKK